MSKQITVGQNEAEMNALKLQIETMRRLEQTSIAQVMSVYSGRPGCACGCRGKYTYATAHKALGTKHRGYKVEDSECNDATVKLIYNKMLRALRDDTIEVICDGSDGVFGFDVGQRTYTLYTTKAK